MGNYSSEEIQLTTETLEMFTKIIGQNSVTKKNLISLSRKFKNLKKINPDKYKTLSNKAHSIMRAAIGLSNMSNLVKLQALYKDFKNKI